MTISRLKVKNYRALRSVDISFGEGINILVGNNESGKSTLLEAINLALRCQLNRRAAQYELHTHLMNANTVSEFIDELRAGNRIPPPEISIEVFLKQTEHTCELRGTFNSEKANECGIRLLITLDESFQEEYLAYTSDPNSISSVPIEYYKIVWQSFSGENIRAQRAPLKLSLIDPSNITNTFAANRYIIEIIRDYLSKQQSVNLSLAYRGMKDEFLRDDKIVKINDELRLKQGIVSTKPLSVALDTTNRANWEAGIIPHLDKIPLTLVGKGEQNSIKIKLAVEASESCDILLIEEPENHLSHTNLGKLISHLSEKSKGKQVIISTHSSFVLNKLGIENIMMFNGEKAVTLNCLPDDTRRYFQRLPGHDTLRLILAERSILVEGPSDELIVQKGYIQQHRRSPLEDGVEVISVGTSFKRFLDIARLLKLDVCVVRDNDGEPARIKALYKEYDGEENISICIDDDPNAPTLEPQIAKVNELDVLNKILDVNCKEKIEISNYMELNKTKSALSIFESNKRIKIPEYIRDAIR